MPISSSVHGTLCGEYWRIAIFTPRSGYGMTQWYSAYSPRSKSSCGWAVFSYDSLGMLTSPSNSFRLLGLVPSLGIADRTPSPSCSQRAAVLSYLGPLSGSCQIPLFTASNSSKTLWYFKSLNFLYSSFSLCLIPPPEPEKVFCFEELEWWDGPLDNPDKLSC